MKRVLHTNSRRGMAAVGAVTMLAMTGCGSSRHDKNHPRPPAPILLTAYISDDAVSVDPARFGAGPVKLVITNQSADAQEVTFESAGSAAGFRQQIGPINPRDVAELRADIPTGKAVVRVDTGTVKPARITVTGRRPSAQNELLQP